MISKKSRLSQVLSKHLVGKAPRKSYERAEQYKSSGRELCEKHDKKH